MHFIRILWDNESKRPFFDYRLNPNIGSELRLPINVGETIGIEIQDGKYCFGSFELPTYSQAVCSKNQFIGEVTINSCGSCSFKDSTHFLALNALSFEQIQLLRSEPNMNYINLFGNGMTKTGVAAIPRKFTRLLEQGAIASLYFATTNGYESRRIESFVSNVLKIKQSLTWDSKVKELSNISSEEEARKILSDLVLKIKEILPEEFKSFLLNEPEFYYNYNLYNISTLSNLTKVNFVNQFTKGEIYSGKVVGIYGDILFLEVKSNQVLALNTRPLQGYIINISDSLLENNIKSDLKNLQFTPKPVLNVELF